MAAAVPTAAESTTPEAPVSRAVRLVRAIVLLLGGLAITFSATLHEQLGFDLGISAAVIGAVGIAHLVEWVSRRGSSPSAVPLIAGAVSVVAAVALPFTASAIGFAVTVAAWALVAALLEFVGAAVRPGSRPDATLLGAIGVLLALLALLFREDPVAVVGLLGAYAIIAGVFLAISAFDIRRGPAANPADSSAAAGSEPTAP